MIVIDNEYNIGDIVYLKTDEEQLARQIFSIEVYTGGELLYKLVQGTHSSSHYAFEITTEKNVVPM